MAGFGAKVKLTVDRSSKAEFNKQINDLVGQIKISNKFTVLQKDMDRVRKEAQAMLNSNPMTLKVNKIDCSAAVTNVKKQLQTMLSSLSVTNGVNITGLKDFLGAEGVDATMRSTADAANAAVQKMNEAKKAAADWAGQMAVLDSIAQRVATTYKTGISGSNMITDDAEVQRITAAYNEWAKKVNEVKASHTGNVEALQQEGLAIQRNITAIQKRQVEEAKAAAAAERAAREAELAAQREESANEAEIASLKQIASLRERMTKFLQANTKLNYTDVGKGIRSMLTELNSGASVTTERLREMEGEFANIRAQATTTGSLGKTMLDALSKAYEKFGGWMLVTRSLVAAIRTIKSMVGHVRELDSALAQLQIVTGATDAQLESFLSNATNLAKDLGKKITDILSSIETFSRLGYSLEDATKLAEYANILSNVAAVDTDTATTGMTSIIKGYNMDVENVAHVADVLVEVGQKYAVSAAEMIEAYEKAGAALNATNTSFEKSAGLIAAANASVQNASTVGTALKTISARIRGATADLEELGEDTEDLAQGFSKYAKEIQALTGFNIMVEGTTDTYKDIYEIFEGIAKVWKDLSDTQQARVAEILGGTRQLQVISSILGNWGDAAGAYADAMAAAGTATEANAIYMDTIEGKLGILNATFQEFSNNLFNSDLVKFFVDLATSILGALNALQKLHVLLPLVTLAIVAIVAERRRLLAIEQTSMINTLASKLIAEKAATDALTSSVAKLTVAEKRKLAVKIQEAVVSGELNAAQAQQILTTLGLATAEGTLTVANTTLAASFKALMASIPVWGWVALGISTVITAVSWLTSSFKSNEEKLQELNEEYDTLTSNIKSIANEFQTLKKSADEVIPRFAELAKGVNQFGDNVSLTDEEYTEFLELNNRIAEMFPELNLGLDESGNYMLALSYGADTLTDSLYDLLEVQRLLAAQEQADKLPDLVKNVKEQEKVYKDEQKALENRLWSYQLIYDKYAELYSAENINKYKEAYGDDWERYFKDAINISSSSDGSYLQDAFDAANNLDSWRRMLAKFTDDVGYVDWWSLLNCDEFKNVLAGIDREMDNLNDKIAAKWSSINPTLRAWLQTDFIYNDMNEQMQTIADAMVSGLDFSALGLDTAESIENYITDYILNPLYNSGAAVRATFAEITDWKEELKNGEISFEEFSERVEKAFDDLIDSMDEDEVGKFKDNFVAGFNAIGIEGRSFNAVVDGIIESWGKLASAPQVDAKGAIGDLADGLSDLKKAYDLLNKAQEEMAVGRGLSADTIASLAAAEENYLDYLYEENGVIKLNTEAWKENANARMKHDMSIIWDEIDALEEKNAALREQLKIIAEAKPIDLSSLSGLPGIGGLLGNSEWAQRQVERIFENFQNGMFEKINSELGDNIAVIEEYMAKLSMINSLYESIAGQLESTFSAFDSYTSGMSHLADLQELVANGYTVAADKVRELAAIYPEILEAAEATASGQIRLNEDVVNSVLQGKRVELDGTIDAEIGKLEAKRALLQAELDIINEQIAAAESADEATVASANEAAGARMAIEQAVLTACEQAGIDEKTANELALAAMTGDWDTFSTLAQQAMYDLDDESATAFTSVMNNFATMARNVVNNTNEIIGAYSRMGEALQNAMNGLTTGKYNAAISGGSVFGSGKEAVSGILTDMFDSAKSDYGSGGTTLDSQMEVWQQRLQAIADTYANNKANISDLLARQASLVDQIASVDGQIQLLQSLKNAPIKTFKSGSSSSGSGSGSGSSKKEVEEYIADIDKYREALERLRKAQESTEKIEQEIERIQYTRVVPQEDIDALNAENDILLERNRLLEDTLGAIEYYNEVQKEVSELNIDPNKTVFGNVDLNNRQVLEWTDDMLNQYQDAIKSWGKSAEDFAGSISTVLGTWNEFDGVPIAFSPLLQTENGPVYLDSNTAHNYIQSLIEKAGEGWSFDQLLYLDAEGLEVNGRRIQNLIADIGDTAEATAASMHYLGTDGAIQGSFEEISVAAERLGISVEELIQQYDALNAEYDINEQKIYDNQSALASYEQAARSEAEIIRRQINLRKELIISYNEQQKALHNLNNQRDATIMEGAETLRNLGFAVQYNADTNELWISNMEHINELVADNKGKYDTLQEATNALRKETENLINTLEDLNDENRECSATWWELKDAIRDAKIAIVDDLKEIVNVASEAVDEIQKVYDTLHKAADEYAENGGFISVDTLQSIFELGAQYMQYLQDENGLLVINEENINKVIAAKTRQLAAEQALTYVERLRLALQEDSIESLNTLLYATTAASDATFGLAYAELALMHQLGDLDDQQYAAALHNIQAIESLANTAIASIGQTASSAKDELEKMKSGIDDILKYVMDMLKHRIQQQIDALEDMKDAYSDIIKLRKEALDAAKKEADYEDKVAEKIKEMAKLQERINALSLDDSRDAQAQKAKLEEDLAKLQKELADEQNDYAVDAQKDALDDMEDAYKREKDAEIAHLEETISSYQKLYDMAIAYIENHWDTLYQELIAWNTEYGSVLNSEITTAWENCLAAAQRYGSYVAALNSIDNDIAAAGSSNGSSGNTVVGNSGSYSSSTNEEAIHSIIKQMYANSQAWFTSNEKQRQALEESQFKLAAMLQKYGINAVRDNQAGVWYIDKVGGVKLYDKYKKYTYHKGGIVGDESELKQNEVMAILEKGEMVLDAQKEKGLYHLIDFTSALSEKLSHALGAIDLPGILDIKKNGADSTSAPLPAVSNTQNDTVHFGDVYIYGASDETVKQHQEINRNFTNEILSYLRIKR